MKNAKQMAELLSTASDPALGIGSAPDKPELPKVDPFELKFPKVQEHTEPVEPPRKKKVVTTTAETIQMYRLIEGVLRQAEDGCWKYEEGWSDAKIAEMIGREGIGANHVAHVRVEMFGHLISPKGQPDIEKRLLHLERMFNHLAAEIGSDLRVTSPGSSLFASGNRPMPPIKE